MMFSCHRDSWRVGDGKSDAQFAGTYLNTSARTALAVPLQAVTFHSIISNEGRTTCAKIGGVFEAAREIVVEIVSGEGGADSKLFADELSSAYVKYAHSVGLTVSILATREGHMTLKVSGDGAWSAFRHEPGKHVCQRVPTTESKGRRHTSLVSVAVMPVWDDAAEPLRDEDIEIDTCGGHGPGGQHQNKTDSAVRMRHLPTGITVFINGRSQHANRREARRVLAARVAEVSRIQAEAEHSEGRQSQMGGGRRGDKVRTYNFIDSRVVDHRLGRKTHQIRRVMRGEIGLIVDGSA